MGRRGDQNLAAQVAALLLRRQLVLEVDARRTGLDEGLHDLEGVQRAAETGFRIGHDRREPIALDPALGVLDLVGALQGAVDPAAQLRRGVGRVERLVRIHGRGGIGVGRHLPARQIDGLQPGADHLHGLVAGHRTQGVDIGLAMQQVPQAVGAAFGQGVADGDRATQALYILRTIGPCDGVETTGRSARDQIFKGCHFVSPWSAGHLDRSCKELTLRSAQRKLVRRRKSGYCVTDIQIIFGIL